MCPVDADDDNLSLHPPWRQAVEEYLRGGFRPGDVLTDDWLFETMGLDRPRDGMTVKQFEAVRTAFVGQVCAFRDCLLHDHQADIKRERGLGYRIVPPAEQSALAYEEGIKALRKAFAAMTDRLVNVNLAFLSAEQRRENADTLARAARMAQGADLPGRRLRLEDRSAEGDEA